MRYWLSLVAKPQAEHSLPHSINKCQQIVNNFWSGILSIISVTLWQELICKVMVTFSGSTVHYYYITHPEKKHQFSVNDLLSCKLGNQGIVLLLEPISELLTTFVGKNTTGSRKHIQSKTIDIPKCNHARNDYWI